MPVTAKPVPNLSDNYAWYIREDVSGAAALVDPADAEACAHAVLAEGGRLDMILLTHHHADHTAGADALRARFSCPVIGPRAERSRLPRLDRAVEEGDRIALGEAFADVMETPGHTLGHISYFFPKADVLACGDTLFSLGCGRLLEGTAAQMFASLRHIATLPPDTRVCCGHEYTESNGRFALAEEPDNLVLQARMEEVRELRAHGQPTVPARLADELAQNPFLRAPDVATFAALRARKDNFR